MFGFCYVFLIPTMVDSGLRQNDDQCQMYIPHWHDISYYSDTTLNDWRTIATALGIDCWFPISINTPQSR